MESPVKHSPPKPIQSPRRALTQVSHPNENHKTLRIRGRMRPPSGTPPQAAPQPMRHPNSTDHCLATVQPPPDASPKAQPNVYTPRGPPPHSLDSRPSNAAQSIPKPTSAHPATTQPPGSSMGIGVHAAECSWDTSFCRYSSSQDATCPAMLATKLLLCCCTTAPRWTVLQSNAVGKRLLTR